MEKHLRILLIDDDQEEFFLLKDLLSQSTKPTGNPSLQLHWAATYEEALEAFGDSAYDAYLIDYRLGGHNGIELIRDAARLGCQAPMIMLTGKGDYQVDLAAMQQGASDYLVKGQLNAPLIERSIRYAIERKGIQNELEKRVQARTQELAEKNEALRAANEQLAQNQVELEEKVAERTRELRRRAEELEALHGATAALLTTLDLDELLEKILDAARSAIPVAEKGMLQLLDTDLNASQGFLTRVVSEKQPLLVLDFRSEPDLLLFGPLPNWQEIRSLIAAPLCLGEECMGVLILGAATPFVFSEVDLHLLVGFAATATAALHNARLYDEVQKLSVTDSLTGLYNRRGLYALSRHEIKQARRHQRFISLILFDLDHFKAINDRYGHPVGDEVLQEVARQVQISIRSIDILARYGGEEFAILLPECDLTCAHQIAERLRRRVARRQIKTKAGTVQITISLGITGSPDGASELDELIETADQALYQAKQKGRNRVEILA